MKQIRIIRTTALILALITVFTTTAAALSCGCGDICVNETGWWRGGGGAFKANTTPIQAAVDDATAGERICVAAGSYNENVDIATAHLTLVGEGAGVVNVTAASSSDHVFEVTVDYVNISGFTVTGAGWPDAGVYLDSGVEHCNLSDNNASNNGVGIYLHSSSNNNTLANNTASNNDCGIYLYSSSNYNTLTSNTASSNNYYGILLYSSNNYNTLTNNTANLNPHYGIWLRSSSNYNTLTNNTASNNGAGIWLRSSSNYNTLANNTANSNSGSGINLYNSRDNTLTSNTASNNYHGISLSNSSDNNTLASNTASNNFIGISLSSSYNTLANNTANSNSGSGIFLSSSSNNTLASNTANSNNDYGILLYSSSDNNVSCNWVQNNSASGFRLTQGSTGNTIEHNNIVVNGVYNASTEGYEYQFHNDQSDDVEAKHNYWGAGMTNDTINASIYDWQDDHSKGNVTFQPRLGGPAPCAPIPELATVLLFAVGLLMLAGYVRVGRRKT